MQIEIIAKKWEKNNIKALITLKIGGLIFCDGFMVRSGKNGLFLSKPSYQKANGEYKDYTYFNKDLVTKILNSYKPDETVIIDVEDVKKDDFPFDM